MPDLGKTAVAALVLLASGTQSEAGSCGCATLPSEGLYEGGDGPVQVEYVADDENSCPQQIKISGVRVQGPRVDVTLSCEPESNTWSGIERTSWRGVPLEFGWRVKPPEAEAAIEGDVWILGGYASVVDNVLVDIDLPEMALAMGKKNRRDIALQLTTSLITPPCVCDRVRLEYEEVVGFRDAYLDDMILSQANSESLRGDQPRFKFWLDDNGVLQSFPASGPNYSYADLAVNSTRGAAPGSADFEAASTAKVDRSIAKEESGRGGLERNAFAALQTNNCKILPPDMEEVAAQCTPDIVIKAALAHEREHEIVCNAINDQYPIYDYEGQSIDWAVMNNGGVVFVNGREFPVNAYVAWSQRPENLSMDESGAYAKEAAILKDWLDKNCGGP